jgi:hypothetical protein
MMLCCADYYIDHILQLFNMILEGGSFPDAWLLSYLVPIFKKGDTRNTDDYYRGIALSSCLGKLFLSVLQRRLSDHMEENELYNPTQHGFREKHSTINNIFILDTLKRRSDKKCYACCVHLTVYGDLVYCINYTIRVSTGICILSFKVCIVMLIML